MNYRENKNEEELVIHSTKLFAQMKKRRSVRAFNGRVIPREVMENCIAIAGSAPSGANMQPWSFVLVSDKTVKKEIRNQAERVEKVFYKKIASKEWEKRLVPLKTSWKKPFLEEAPYLICIFSQKYGFDGRGNKVKHYYTAESVGIATGFLISALHRLGISCLTYTPAPMTFLKKILGRPVNEKPFMIIAAGYPKKSYQPPRISRKKLGQILTIV